MAEDSNTQQIGQYLKDRPLEEVDIDTLVRELGVERKSVSAVIYNLRSYHKLPIVSVGKGVYMYKPDGVISTERVAKRTEARQKAVRAAVTGERVNKAGRRINDESLATRRENNEQKIHRRAVILYELMEANKNGKGEFRGKIKALVEKDPKLRKEFFYGGKFAPLGINKAHSYLLEIGAIGTRGPANRFFIQHPDELRPEMESGIAGTVVPVESTTVAFDSGSTNGGPRAPRPPIPQPQPERTLDAVDSVNPDDLAAAVAELMWVRYEQAITEVGRLNELLAMKDQEIARLNALVEEMPSPSANDVARRMLSGSRRR